MIYGTGIDIVELERIEKLIERQERFVDRILTESEEITYRQLSAKRKIEYVAGRFAAKEAYAKAVGTGIGEHLAFTDIEIGIDEKGKPLIVRPSTYQAHVSISHSRDYAVASVILEKQTESS
ncbi:holo-ACP synthase [Bacillus sp. HMF5848]|uniref:holo-ACP synthase n=1 Tax=Bacillus sp. HMF5848 TaxID=2495421 RepID=UPI000F7B1442|nr:holo-ACP synthase [Bacillus sp. HMF5848]RSK25662.1 holo-ACP synthase [Bacillus sp. HMF5848]